ncbi:MAG: TonB-dependent receptor [Pseudomonadota bacterium]|nr:TonB-dependent receptor [Pseudomonadota bacterium]
MAPNNHQKNTLLQADHFEAHASSGYGKYAMQPLAAAVVAALSPGGAAVAQEEDDGVRLEEVIVTATKREINLQDVPHNINVLSSVDLERMNAMNLDSQIKALPSVSMNNTVPGRNSLVVRGISSGGFDYRRDAQTSIYIDEQPMTTSSQQVGVRAIDMERIEMLAGPQGTLFGSSSQSGTLRYITKKPHTNGFGGKVEAHYGVTDGGEPSFDVNGVLNVPVVEDKLAVRAVAYSSKEGGYVDNVYGTSLAGNFDNAQVVEDDFNEYDVNGARFSALWAVTDKWSALASVVTESTHAEGSWETDPYLGDHKITRFIKEDRDDDWYSAGLTVKGDLGFAELAVTATHFDREIAYNWDNNSYAQQKDRWFGGGLYNEQYYAGNPYYYQYYNMPLYNSDYLASTIFNDQEQQRDAIEIRLTSSGDSRLQYTAGFFYEDVYDYWYYGTVQPGVTNSTMWGYANYLAYFYGVSANYYNAYTPNTNITYPLVETDVSYSNTLRRTIKQTALFAEVTYDITDEWALLGGIRWVEYDRDEYSRFAFPEGLPAGDRGTSDGSFSNDGVTDDIFYKLGIRYNLDDDKMIYGLFSQGMRLGGTNSQRAARTGRVPLVYNPDFLDNYELGIKSTWADGRFAFNANIYYMEWSDYQFGASFNEWWLRGTVNASTAETLGVEYQMDWQVTDRLLLSANGLFADPQYSANWSNNFVGGVQQPSSPGDLTVTDGMVMPNAPKNKGYISAYYEIPDVWNGNLWFFIDHSYQSEVWVSNFHIINNETDGLAPAWTYTSAAVGLQFDNGLDVELHVENLLNDKGYSWVSTGEGGDAELFGDPRWHTLRSLDRPRTVWLSVKRSFGAE